MDSDGYSPPNCALLKQRRNLEAANTTTTTFACRVPKTDDSFRHSKQITKMKKGPNRVQTMSEDIRDSKDFNEDFAREKRLEKYALKGKIQRAVEDGMAAYEESINDRRRKLCSMLVAEEAALTEELMERNQTCYDAKMADMRRRMWELRAEREKEHREMVAGKRMQQYLARCVDIRDIKSKMITEDAKRCNLAQMTENRARKESEKELEMLWHDLLLREIEAKKEREVEEAKRREFTSKMTCGSLDYQIAGIKALEEQKRRMKVEELENLERLRENVRIGDQLDRDRRNQRQELLRKDLDEQLTMKKNAAAQRAAEEKATDTMYGILNESEMRSEGMRKSEKEKLRKETLAYLDHLEATRYKEMHDNKEVEFLVEEYRKNAEAQHFLGLQKSKEARERLFRDVIEGREKQLQEKRQAEELEKAQTKEEAFLQQKQLDAELEVLEQRDKERREQAKRYGEELKKQQRYLYTIRREEQEEIEQAYRAGLEKEYDCEHLTEMLLKASENVTPHAFAIPLKDRAVRGRATDWENKTEYVSPYSGGEFL